MATPQGFRRNPALVHEFYNGRRRGHASVKPNAAHHALARLEREHAGSVTIVTQNIDALHEAAGSKNLIHMHGELLKAWCTLCDARHAWPDDLSLDVACPACGKATGMRPDVVWFGEMPYHMERIGELLGAADLFISIGTSGNVYPAAGFVAEAGRRRAYGGTQSRTLRRRLPLRRSHPRPRHGNRAGVCGADVDGLPKLVST